MMKTCLLVTAAALISFAAHAQSDGPSIFEFFDTLEPKRFRGMAHPEETGQGYLSPDNTLYVNHSGLINGQPVDNRVVVNRTLARVGEFCASSGGAFWHEVKADAEPGSVVGVHSCRCDNSPIFDVVVKMTPPRKVGRSPEFFLFPHHGGAPSLRERLLAEGGEAVPGASPVCEASRVRADLKPGDTVRYRGRSVLVVEVKPPLAFVQPDGGSATWVKVDELGPN